MTWRGESKKVDSELEALASSFNASGTFSVSWENRNVELRHGVCTVYVRQRTRQHYLQSSQLRGTHSENALCTRQASNTQKLNSTQIIIIAL